MILNYKQTAWNEIVSAGLWGLILPVSLQGLREKACVPVGVCFQFENEETYPAQHLAPTNKQTNKQQRWWGLGFCEPESSSSSSEDPSLCSILLPHVSHRLQSCSLPSSLCADVGTGRPSPNQLHRKVQYLNFSLFLHCSVDWLLLRLTTRQRKYTD